MEPALPKPCRESPKLIRAVTEGMYRLGTNFDEQTFFAVVLNALFTLEVNGLLMFVSSATPS